LKKKIISVLNYLFFLLVGALFLWLVFRKVDLQEVLEDILKANYYWIGVAIIAGLLSHVLRAARWNILINSLGYPTRLSTTFYSVMIGYLANLAVPRLGEVSRCGVLSKKDKIPFNGLFGTVVVERVFDMVILLLIIIAVIALQLKLVGAFVNRTIIIPLFSNVEKNIGSILIFSFLAALIVFLIIFLIRRYKERLKKMSLYIKIAEFFHGFVEGIKTIKNMRRKGLFLLYTFLIWTLYSSMVYTAFLALEGTDYLDFGDGITVMAIGSLGIVAPVPGGIGTYHFITKAILVELYAVLPAAAAAYATLSHAAQTLMIILLGSLSFVLILIQKRRQTNGNA
jgi:uncharacterized protein (TIRG00374 family)